MMCFLSGCGETTTSILENAVTSIDATPGRFQDALLTAINKLQQNNSDLLDKVQSIYNGAVGQAQAATMCTASYFGLQIKDQLAALLHQIDSEKPAPTLHPTVCDTNPSTSVVAGTNLLVTYYGYDFDVFNTASPFYASVQYSDGPVVTSNFGHISIVSPYEVVLEFQAADFSGLDRSRGPQLVLSWNSSAVKGYETASSKLPIVIPKPAEPILGSEQFEVQAHADSGWFSGGCVPVDASRSIDTGTTGNIRIDRSRGDPGHPGISETTVKDNNQSKKSLRGYNYYASSSKDMAIKGTICGASALGPGAIFDRVYTVYTISNP
jgi:hypothetical protein